ncbi:hypothetical protein COT42_02335 [Candidatus Saganbacteria bacterium CG08_land_8_20_14_0_20_45_16]|uniref:Uncharacterized protein n=1 Tax=Candidatus Saganbacteria bacterium CG08_land_8_20_14_0_20_45_16 TaxID=2014293 RepID=A0A2H0Y0A9_UNCSA|nr:MAG: hypothetical protein COT42_02335 [Candidatus Saganbacteria bacterium CG08_land_8_20_14_0_20_45_16]
MRFGSILRTNIELKQLVPRPVSAFFKKEEDLVYKIPISIFSLLFVVGAFAFNEQDHQLEGIISGAAALFLISITQGLIKNEPKPPL